MENIDGKAGALNPVMVGFKKKNYIIILTNQNFLKRLHSAKTLYGKQKFSKDFIQSELYKKNYSKIGKSTFLKIFL